jgi:hypothetical protein
MILISIELPLPARRSAPALNDDIRRYTTVRSRSLGSRILIIPAPTEETITMAISEGVPYEHVLHPRTIKVLSGQAPPPPKVDDERVGLNGKIGLLITTLVGTMICAYVFGIIALVSLPSAITSHNLTIIIAWISSNFLQLVLLPVIIVGQNLQAKASDKRAESTYKDAEAVLHEAIEIQKHLAAQDVVLSRLGRGGQDVARP